MFAFFKRTVLVGLVFLATGTLVRAEEGDEHLLMGNPSGATADKTKPDNYLVKKRHYALSYNNSKGTPNWSSWHLSKAWLGMARRGNPFAPDTSLPVGFFIVRPTGTGARSCTSWPARGGAGALATRDRRTS